MVPAEVYQVLPNCTKNDSLKIELISLRKEEEKRQVLTVALLPYNGANKPYTLKEVTPP